MFIIKLKSQYKYEELLKNEISKGIKWKNISRELVFNKHKKSCMKLIMQLLNREIRKRIYLPILKNEGDGGKSADKQVPTNGYDGDDYGANCCGDACAYDSNDTDHHIYHNKRDGVG